MNLESSRTTILFSTLRLLKAYHIIVIELDDNKPVLAKIAKDYDIIAKSSVASIRIDTNNIKTSEAHHYSRL